MQSGRGTRDISGFLVPAAALDARAYENPRRPLSCKIYGRAGPSLPYPPLYAVRTIRNNNNTNNTTARRLFPDRRVQRFAYKSDNRFVLTRAVYCAGYN